MARYRSRDDWLSAGRAFHLLAHRITQLETELAVYTALERGRAYRIRGEVMLYVERVFEEDMPAGFVFTSITTGEQLIFLLDQLTGFEARGELQYIGLIPESMET